MENQKQTIQSKKGQIGLEIVTGFVIIGAVLLLLVMLIYFFGVVGTSLETTAESQSVVNETGGYVNSTGYQLADGFTGNPRTFSVATVINNNQSGAFVIPATNYTVSTGGLVTNSTVTSYLAVNITYNYVNDSAEIIASRDAGTNTSNAIPLVGILFIIIAIGAVIGILVVSLMGRRFA